MNQITHRLPNSSWDEIKLGFLAGQPVAALAEKHGVKPSRIYKRATRYGWVDEREKFSGEIDELTGASFERAKEKFRTDVALSFGPWLEMAEQIRRAIGPGDVDAFNTAVSAVTKLHQSGQKHFNLTDAPQMPIIWAGDIGGRADPADMEPAQWAIEAESATPVNGAEEVVRDSL